MFSYAFKRITRSSGLFVALLLGVVLASTFFAGINIGADTTAKAALNQQLSQVLVDIVASRVHGLTLSSTNWTTAAQRMGLVRNVDDIEIITRVERIEAMAEKNFSFVNVVGISDDSRVHSGLNVTSGAETLQENETYVWVGSQDADRLRINDTLAFNYVLWTHTDAKNVSLRLKVAGFVELDETAYRLASRQYQKGDSVIVYAPSIREDGKWIYYGNILIVNWEKTFAGILDSIHKFDPSYSPFRTEILVSINREAVINPWDIGASQEKIDRVILQIDNEIAEFGITAYSNLQNVLNNYQFLSMGMRLAFMVVALPVFFVAWYVGSTVSDVSFNLRRREIGLLSAKGFSSGQLFRLFLSESLLVGILGGLIGVGLSFLLSPFFVAATGGKFGGASPILTQEVVVLAIVFGTGITLLSTFRPSRRAAKLPTVDALKEYMYVEETKPYQQKWPWMALFLGSYKIGMFLIGIPSLMNYLMGRHLPTTNIFVTILLAAWMIVDSVLTPIGPLLFFWGFTKIFVRGSLWFQELVTRAAKFLGDLGMLATRNVRRNPARTASVAFLIAMIIGYGFQTVGALASEEDFVVRQIKANVGADISIYLNSLANATYIMGDIADLLGVASITLEYSFYEETSLSLRIIAVEPQEWPHTAYYEKGWFTGNDVTTAFHQLTTDNRTIILERGIASNLELEIDDLITLRIGQTTMKLSVVGFFGPEISGGSQPDFRLEEPYFGSPFWSYVPANLYHTLDTSVFASGRILVKLEKDADQASIVSQIRNLDSSDISHVYSVVEQLEQRESSLILSGTANVQRMGVIFAVIAASVATALVAMVGMQERRKELTIMNVRGLSFKQLIIMLLAENLSIIVFSVILGVTVGLIIVHGSIVALNTTQYITLVAHRMVFPPDAIVTLSASLILVFASSILPIIGVTKRYVSKMDRIVRA